MPIQSLSLPSFGTPGTGTPSSPLSSSTTSRIRPLAPSAFSNLVSSETVLVLDLRPPSSFEASHVAGAQSISVPSTLLRRPAFGLQKLVNMLTPASRAVVGKWKNMTDIVLIDHDSGAAPEGSVLCGVANKFEREGFTGKLWFLHGGHLSIRNDTRFKFESSDTDQDQADQSPTPQSAGPSLGRLSRLAFQQGE